MLLKCYTKQVLRAENNPNSESLYCFAELEDDVGAVLPYLKKSFEDAVYSAEVPFLSLKMRGKKITIYPSKIVINALKDEEEADAILKWLQRVMNEIWETGLDIKKDNVAQFIPDPVQIFSTLPQSHCGECGQESCMSFSTLVAAGIRAPDECPRISKETKNGLKAYLGFLG